MRKLRLDRGFAGVALLLMSCGDGNGQTGTAGNGGGGRAGSGAGGQAGSTDGGGASCANTPACGGNIVGVWKVTEACLTATQDLTSVCPGAFANLAYTFSGTVTYSANGTINSTVTATVAAHEHYPSGCMPFGETCAQLMQVALDAGIPDNCSTDATGACNCDGVVPATVTDPPATYSTSGSALTITLQSGSTSTNSYCVQGNVLYEFGAPADGGPTTSSGAIVLTRQ